MATELTTRETFGAGATVKNAPLTNEEVDLNFISITTNKLEASNNLSDLTDPANGRTNLGVEIGVDVQGFDINTAKYDDAVANFSGDLQVNNSSVITFDATNPSFTDTGALGVPSGTEEQKPSVPIAGQIRYNEDSNKFEGYYTSNWGVIGAPTIESDDGVSENYHIVFADQTSGELLTGFVSPTDFTYNASNGEISAGRFNSTDGFSVNGTTVIGSDFSLNLSNGTESISLPSGTTAERPSNAVNGDIRFNTDLNQAELYNGSKWALIADNLEKATLNKSFSANETVEIQLSLPTVNPSISVQKEVPQIDITASDWSLCCDTNTFNLHDTSYNTTITPSSATEDGTFTLGTGSFSERDVGKIVVGNGGEAVLLSSDGSYEINSPFNNTTAINSADWKLFDLTFDSGIKYAAISQVVNLSEASYTGKSLSLSSVGISDGEGLAFNRDGTKLYIASDDVNVIQYTLSTPWDLDTASSGQVTSTSISGASEGVFVSNDGTDFYTMDNGGEITQYSLSNPFDADSESQVRTTTTSGTEGLFFRSDGSRLYVTSSGTVYQYDLSTPWNISTKSSEQSNNISSTTIDALYIDQSDGNTLYILDSNNDIVEYSLSTPWDITTASATGSTFSVSSQVSSSEGLFFSDNGQIFAMDQTAVYQYSLGTQLTVLNEKYSSALTTVSGQISTEYWTDINNMLSNDTLNDGNVYYAFSTDNQTSFDIVLNGSGVRKIVRNNNGSWEININTSYGSETWAAATVNDIHNSLEEAVAISINRMPGSQLQSASDSDYFNLTNTLDLGIILYMPQNSSASPLTNGIEINYDANAKNEGAVLGTDYSYHQPESDVIFFTSLSNNPENLKIRAI